ncbi:hypothetical protein [Lentzea sp. NPDC055074]
MNDVFVRDGGELVLSLGDVEVADTTGGGDALVAGPAFALMAQWWRPGSPWTPPGPP